MSEKSVKKNGNEAGEREGEEKSEWEVGEEEREWMKERKNLKR